MYDKYKKLFVFFFSSRRRHTRWTGDWSSDVCSSDLLGVRDLIHQAFEKPIELRRRREIDGLVQIVGGSVIALRVPFPIDRFLRRSVLVAENKGDSGDSVADEIVLIAAAEQAALRFVVRLNANP